MMIIIIIIIIIIIVNVLILFIILGAASVNAPRSDVEITRNMSILNDHNSMAIPIKLMIPNTAEGNVR